MKLNKISLYYLIIYFKIQLYLNLIRIIKKCDLLGKSLGKIFNLLNLDLFSTISYNILVLVDNHYFLRNAAFENVVSNWT